MRGGLKFLLLLLRKHTPFLFFNVPGRILGLMNEWLDRFAAVNVVFLTSGPSSCSYAS